jgi:ribosomal protein S18 acetylase RimI-like enzyme
VTPGDDAFLFELYADTRREEFAALGWNESALLAFLRSQFDLQTRAYATAYPQGNFQLILCAGEPVGRMYVARQPDEYRLVDLALLSEYRGRGIGTKLLQQLVSKAQAEGLPVRFHVELNNRARRLYERLGFKPVHENGPYLLMERAPNPS